MEGASEIVENKITDEALTNSIEKLNQRREARRRKILDNAKQRMEKLGVRSNDYKAFEERQNGAFEYSDPEVEPNEVKFPYKSFLDVPASSNSEQYDPFAEEKPVEDHFIFKYRLHVLVSIALTHALALLGFMDNWNYSVMIPTCICMALEVVIRKPKPVNPITALVVTLCQLPTNIAHVIWRLSTILYDIVVNLGLTIFCIVILTFINDRIRGSNLLTLQ